MTPLTVEDVKNLKSGTKLRFDSVPLMIASATFKSYRIEPNGRMAVTLLTNDAKQELALTEMDNQFYFEGEPVEFEVVPE